MVFLDKSLQYSSWNSLEWRYLYEYTYILTHNKTNSVLRNNIIKLSLTNNYLLNVSQRCHSNDINYLFIVHALIEYFIIISKHKNLV